MTIVISKNLTITDSESGGGIINANNPIVGYETRVTSQNVSSTTSASGFPASNLANPSTNLRWQGVATSPEQDEYVTLNLQTAEEVDYIGIARHNLGSAEIPVSIEVEDDTVSPATWSEVVSDTLLPNDGPVIFRFTPQAVTRIRIRMQPGTAAPEAAVVYCGKLLVLQRRIYVGHTPITDGIATEAISGRSQAGHYLGTIILNETTRTTIELQNLTPAWYRSNMRPFLQQTRRRPFFWGWRPTDYPNEAGFVWLTNDPRPQNELANGMMSITLEVAGVV